MKPWIWLRIAAGLQTFHSIAHTLGGTPRVAQRGAAEEALFNAMQSFHFEVMGANRSHWDFYQGFSLTIGVNLLILAVLTWQMGNLSRTDSHAARPLLVTLLLSEILIVALSWIYFFAAPAVTSMLITACLVIALIGLREAEPAMAVRPARAG